MISQWLRTSGAIILVRVLALCTTTTEAAPPVAVIDGWAVGDQANAHLYSYALNASLPTAGKNFSSLS